MHLGITWQEGIKFNDYEKMKKIWNDASHIIDTGLCYKCPQDDIGYCGLRRNSEISEKEKFVKYCFPSLLEWWECQLEEK